jgi:ribonuclease HI
MPNVELWTDGSSTGGVGAGGWAYVLRYGEHEKWDSGYADDTTNQRMEMTAMLMGLRALTKPNVYLTVFTDSAYLMNAFAQGWLKRWARNNWVTGRGKNKRVVANRDIWEALRVEAEKHIIHFTKVEGHDVRGRFPLNDRVDELAVEARKDPSRLVTVELPSYDNLEMTLV